MPFQKGQSGNPAGRKKGSGKDSKCKHFAEHWGIDYVIRIAMGTEPGFSEKDRLDAAKYLIDHGIGRAPQAVSLDAEVSETTRLILNFPPGT